jgi:predicted Zn-dependent protease
MIGEKQCYEILKSALKYANSKKPDFVDFLLLGWDSSVTRVANSQIHQNVSETEATLAVDVIHNLRIGSASTSVLSEESIHRAIDVAFESTLHKAQLPGSLRLDSFSRGTKQALFSDKTAGCNPMDRARIVQKLIQHAKRENLITSAKLHTGTGEIGIANSLETLTYTCFTDANLSTILTGQFDSHYGSIASHDITALNFDSFFNDLISKCRLQNRKPVDLFAGKRAGDEIFYDVILHPSAVAEWIDFLSYTGFNGLSYHEEESFLFGKLGQKIMGGNITIRDDGNDPAGYILPFDLEGTPKSTVYFIQNGIAKNVAYDGLLAAKSDTKSTGHSLGAGQRHLGAFPLNLHMEGDDQSLDYMIASSEDPTIYVTRFHYTNVADTRNVVLTGMTKDGTFLVEGGEIVRPVTNLRYLQSVVEAFNRVEMMSDPVLVHDPDVYGALLPSSNVVPAMKIQKVRFIGSTGQ